MKLEPTVTEVEAGRVLRYSFGNGHNAVSYRDVLRLWAEETGFRSSFNKLLSDAPFEAYRWETPPVNDTNVDRPFEFVLLNALGFAKRATDTASFAEHFVGGGSDSGVISFLNLRGDATMVVPTPRTENVDTYNHLASFVRNAPATQTDALWKMVSASVTEVIRERTVWLNTAGDGVAWLHVRLDSRPKYYGHRPYRQAPVP